MRTALEIILVILLLVTGTLYYFSKQECIRVQKIAAYLTFDAREQVDNRWKYFSKRVRMAKCFSERSKNPMGDSALTYLEKISVVMDSALIRLRNIDSLSIESERTAAYEEYKLWMNSKKPLFFYLGESHYTNLFNPILGLDKGLFSETLITIEHFDATQLSTLILEDELSILINREAQEVFTIIHSDGTCDGSAKARKRVRG